MKQITKIEVKLTKPLLNNLASSVIAALLFAAFMAEVVMTGSVGLATFNGLVALAFGAWIWGMDRAFCQGVNKMKANAAIMENLLEKIIQDPDYLNILIGTNHDTDGLTVDQEEKDGNTIH